MIEEVLWQYTKNAKGSVKWNGVVVAGKSGLKSGTEKNWPGLKEQKSNQDRESEAYFFLQTNIQSSL